MTIRGVAMQSGGVRRAANLMATLDGSTKLAKKSDTMPRPSVYFYLVQKKKANGMAGACKDDGERGLSHLMRHEN